MFENVPAERLVQSVFESQAPSVPTERRHTHSVYLYRRDVPMGHKTRFILTAGGILIARILASKFCPSLMSHRNISWVTITMNTRKRPIGTFDAILRQTIRHTYTIYLLQWNKFGDFVHLLNLS